MTTSEALVQTAKALRAHADALEALAAVTVAQTVPVPSPQDGDDRLLTVNEAAALLGTSTDWLYRRSSTLPFARKLGPRTLRFSERGLRRYMDSRRP